MEAVLARDPGAVEELVNRFQGLCWHIISRMVRDRELTRELCQDTFLRIHLHLHQYRGDSPLKSWVGRVAYSVALRHLERKRISQVDGVESEEVLARQPALDPALVDSCAGDELTAKLHAEMEALPPLQRMLLTLYHLEEMEISEIAAITALSEGTIRSHLFRSRKYLRDRMLKKYGDLL